MDPCKILLFAVGLWVCAGQSPAGATTITLCGDVWCPYNCYPGTDHPGFAVEIAQEVFAQAGYGMDYQTVSWARCIEDARTGRFSGIIGAIPTDAPDFTYSSRSIGFSSNGFAFRRGDHFHYAGPGSLDGRVLGVVRSYAYNGPIGAYLKAHGQDSSRVEYVSGNGALIKNLDKLAAGRIDVVLDDASVLRTTIARLGLSAQLTIEDEHDGDPVYVGFSPKAPQPALLARILGDGIARLRASGRLAVILARYQVDDWED